MSTRTQADLRAWVARAVDEGTLREDDPRYRDWLEAELERVAGRVRKLVDTEAEA
jgi:hypothetical protein